MRTGQGIMLCARLLFLRAAAIHGDWGARPILLTKRKADLAF
jgi:hypothetical protein